MDFSRGMWRKHSKWYRSLLLCINSTSSRLVWGENLFHFNLTIMLIQGVWLFRCLLVNNAVSWELSVFWVIFVKSSSILLCWHLYWATVKTRLMTCSWNLSWWMSSSKIIPTLIVLPACLTKKKVKAHSFPTAAWVWTQKRSSLLFLKKYYSKSIILFPESNILDNLLILAWMFSRINLISLLVTFSTV